MQLPVWGTVASLLFDNFTVRLLYLNAFDYVVLLCYIVTTVFKKWIIYCDVVFVLFLDVASSSLKVLRALKGSFSEGSGRHSEYDWNPRFLIGRYEGSKFGRSWTDTRNVEIIVVWQVQRLGQKVSRSLKRLDSV